MPRGEQLRTKIRREILAAETTAIAVEDARLQIEKKRKKNQKIQEWLKEKFDTWMNRMDPIELAAILGTTFVLKQGIEFSEDLATNPATHRILQVLLTFQPELGTHSHTHPEDQGTAGYIPPTNEQLEDIAKALDTPQVEIIEWLLCFTAATLIVRNFGAIIGAGQDLVSIGQKLLLGTFVP